MLPATGILISLMFIFQADLVSLVTQQLQKLQASLFSPFPPSIYSEELDSECSEDSQAGHRLADQSLHGAMPLNLYRHILAKLHDLTFPSRAKLAPSVAKRLKTYVCDNLAA
jgi:hypothetical protein